MGVLDGIGLFLGYLILHALPPILVAAVAGALVGWFIAQVRMAIERGRIERP